MADGVKISLLPGASTPSDSDVVAGVQGGTTKKFSFANIYAWLKARLVPEDIGAVPDSRTINGKALSSDISLTASDVGARPDNWMPTAAQVGARPDTWTPSAQDVGAVPVASVGVAGGVPNLDEIGRVPAAQLPPYPTVPAASTSNPQMDGTAAPGTALTYARGDHVHPTDTSRVPTSRTINGYDLTQDRSLTAADVGALASGGTAVAAKTIAPSYTIQKAAGWYKVLEITLTESSAAELTLYVADNSGPWAGMLQLYFNRTTQGFYHLLKWQAITNYDIGDARYAVDTGTGTVSLYVKKYTTATGGLTFQIIRALNRAGELIDTAGYWVDGAAVSEPTSATPAAGPTAELDGAGNNIAEGRLWFSSAAVSAGTAQQILSISNAKITADYVLARIEWADPSYITAGFSWTTAAGSFTLTGTATAATTANVLLARKGN